MSKAAIAEHFEFDERQGDYYANAGVYLGLVDRSDAGFVLSELGSRLIGTRSLARRTELLVEQMLRRPVLRDAFALLQAHGLDVDQDAVGRTCGDHQPAHQPNRHDPGAACIYRAAVAAVGRRDNAEL